MIGIISLFGIVNTLALSVFERTREIGMLRAVGTTRRQLRRMVRYESVITSVIGGLLGVAVGLVFGWILTRPGGPGHRVLDPLHLWCRRCGRGDRGRAGGDPAGPARGTTGRAGGAAVRMRAVLSRGEDGSLER